MLILGIDPGAEGAAVAMIATREKTLIVDTLRFKTVTWPEVALWLARIELKHGQLKQAYLEQVSAMPKQGVTSTFNFGRNYGRILGMLEALGMPFELVTPQKWQKGLGLPPKSKNGATKHKRLLKQVAQQRYPDIKPLTNDLADAILIADYGRFRHGERVPNQY